MLKTAIGRLFISSGYFLSIVGVFCFPGESIAQQSGAHGARLGFATSVLHHSQGQFRLARWWNAADNADTVWLVTDRSQTVPVDSIRLFVLSDPASSPSSAADSIGVWARVPSALVNQARGERDTPARMILLAVFNPSAVSTWTRRQLHTSAARTLLAAEVWRGNGYERAQLFIDGALDSRNGPVVVQQPARASVSPARK
jgi:hypothetical protein